MMRCWVLPRLDAAGAGLTMLGWAGAGSAQPERRGAGGRRAGTRAHVEALLPGNLAALVGNLLEVDALGAALHACLGGERRGRAHRRGWWGEREQGGSAQVDGRA